jgi:hypothetical protein
LNKICGSHKRKPRGISGISSIPFLQSASSTKSALLTTVSERILRVVSADQPLVYA